MRIVAVIVLIAMVVGATLWLEPRLLDTLLPDTSVATVAQPARSPSLDTAPARRPSTAVVPAAGSTPRSPGAAAPLASLARDPVAPASQPLAVQREAERYVVSLTRDEPAPVSAERADHFISGTQVLKLLPEVAVQLTSLSQMGQSRKLAPDTPITVVRSVEQVERVSPGKLISESGGNLDAPVKQVLADDSVKDTTVRELLSLMRSEPEATIRVLRRVEYFEQTTPAEMLAERSSDRRAPVKIVRGSHGIELASVRELLPAKARMSPDTLFYVRTVRESDVQGIWGIVHDGIIKNFARGIAIRRGREINTYQVDIPRDADELKADFRSSYLGKLIYEKSKRSYVYNLRENRMGQNPHRIIPGQEIIIVGFEPDELIDIYKQFVDERG